MKKMLLLYVIMLFVLPTNAETVEINGIFYNLVSKTKQAEVVQNPNKYSGNIEIPETVTNEGTVYTVTTIGSQAFYFCYNLTSITIPNSVTTIMDSAFRGCSGLSSVIIPNSVTSVSGSVFMDCKGLISVSIPNSLTSIGRSMFSDCKKLTSVNIPSSVTVIESSAFHNCSSLTTVIIPNSVVKMEYNAFKGCQNLQSVTIPNSVTSIGDYCFFECSSILEITIPNSLTQIGGWALARCTNLKNIIIEKGQKSFSNGVFAYCPNIETVYCYADNVPGSGTDMFKDSYIELATLYVPKGLIDAYKATTPWKNFKNIVAIDDETPVTPKPKCEKPTISYVNGQLSFASATDGITFVSEITDSDIKKNYEATVTLSATYNITVYATKDGYDNSDVATATLCWIDKDPTTEGIDGISQIRSNAVLIQSEGGIISLQGIDDGTQISVYTADGVKAGYTISRNGGALLNTNLRPGTTAIIKMGEKSVKILVK